MIDNKIQILEQILIEKNLNNDEFKLIINCFFHKTLFNTNSNKINITENKTKLPRYSVNICN